MAIKPTNILLIYADEQTRNTLGCYGIDFMHTPNIDRLAAKGTRFTRATTNAPLCGPARAILATGRYTHQTHFWDNGHPYNGSIPSWGHHLQRMGHHVTAIGKMHYRSIEDDNGIDEEIWPMHVRFGIGDIFGMLRKQEATYPSEETAVQHSGSNVIHGSAMMANAAGPGDSNHIDYDHRITKSACDWLRNESPNYTEKPWVLNISFVSPHFPMIAPPQFYALYPPEKMPWPVQYGEDERPFHPVIQKMCEKWDYEQYFTPEKVRRARAGYYGLCSFLDDNIGKVLQALDDSGSAENTRIIYMSDHGEMIGDHGIWSTSVMYEASVAIPLIMVGPNIPKGHVVDDIVSLVDLYPTMIEAAGETLTDEEKAFPGHSLLAIANGESPERVVLSEYHAGGSVTGFFMIRHGKWKYVHYEGYAPQLFDCEADPNEGNDLGQDPAYEAVRQACDRLLRSVVDPTRADAAAFADQAATIEKHGGAEAVLRRGHPDEHSMDRHLGVE